jgi:DNA adenine methylase
MSLESLFLSLDGTDTVREDYVRAPFAYPGAKSKSLDKILPFLPYRSKYVEPFGGSGAVLLARNSSPLEVFNDRYSGVTVFYRVIQDSKKMNQLLDRIAFFLHSREEFIWCRNTWRDCEDEIERAARWWYTITCSFGSQGRNFGRCIKGKCQIGPKLKNNLKLFPEASLRLRDVQIENQDWRMILKDYDDADTVWYIDPPYYKSTKGMYECEMPDSDHEELLERIFNLQGFVAMSGYDNPMYDSYNWDNRHHWMVNVTALSQSFTESNNLAGKEDAIKRGMARETLYIKEAK